MPPKAAAGGWDDEDDDTPLVALAPKPPPPQTKVAPPKVTEKQESKQSPQKVQKQKEAKKSQDGKKKERESKVDREWMEVDKLLNNSRASKKSKGFDLDYIQDNMATILVVLAGIAIVYFKVKSDGVNFAADYRDQENPFQILGVSESASDAEIKREYRKLSLSLHPDKNPDQSEEDRERYTKITKAYKVVSDPEKRKRWMNNENPDFTPLPSDTTTLTDKNFDALVTKDTAWLILAYADWSNECWELAESWEKVGKDLGRYVSVGRFNVESEAGLAARFNTMSVPMIYSWVRGRRETFFGEPSHANLTMFLTKSLADAVTIVRDNNGGAFLEDQEARPKALLFAQQGMVKLRLVFRAFAVQLAPRMDFAEVQVAGADRLRFLYGVEREPALVFVREAGAAPLMYTGKMTQAKLEGLLRQLQHPALPALHAANLDDLCGNGALGRLPCLLFLHDPARDNATEVWEARGALLEAGERELAASLRAQPPRAAIVFATADLSREPSLRKALGGRGSARVVALDAKAGTFMPMDDSAGPLDPAALVTWAQGLSMRMDGDFDQLAAPLALRPGPWQWKVKGVLRAWTPQMMSAVAVLASGLLLYALHNLYVDLKSNRARDRNAKVVVKARAKAMESEKAKLSKWESIEKQNRQAASRKKAEQEEQQRRREDQQREEAAARHALPAAPAPPPPAPKPQPPPPQAPPKRAAPAPAPAPAQVSDGELKGAIAAVVAGGDLSAMTKKSVREALQARFPAVDLLPRKDLILAEIEAAVLAKAAQAQP